MTYYEHGDRLIAKGEEFAAALRFAGFTAFVAPESLREYMVKIDIFTEKGKSENAVIYYSPGKNRFSLRTHEIKDRKIAEEIEDLWGGAKKEKGKTSFAAYVDGSFINGKGGYGAVILRENKKAEELSGPVEGPTLASMRQVPGEIIAVMEVITWCRKNEVDAITIFFDYNGIEKWATGQWKAKNDLTQKYAAFMKETPVKVFFRKVKSHSGDKWNDYADRLAKKGAGAEEADVTTKPGKDTTVLEGLAAACKERLTDERFIVKEKGIFNDNCAKLEVSIDKESCGHVNIYDTAKGIYGKYHELKETSFKPSIEKICDAVIKKHI